MLEVIESNTITSLNTYAPVITINSRCKFEPWITPEILLKQRDTEYLYRRYQRSNSKQRLSEYRESKNSLNQLITNTKASFYNNRLTKHSNSKNIWTELRNLGLVDSSACVEPKFSTDLLNTFSSSVQCSEENVEIPLIYDPPLPHNFSFPEITIADLNWSARQFTSKSVGFDQLSLDVLNIWFPSIGFVFVDLFNKSLTTHHFPTKWKKVLILPINKIPNPTAPEHFRPISLLCTISKIFEKILYNKILNYLNTHKILDPFQSGFQKGLSQS